MKATPAWLHLSFCQQIRFVAMRLVHLSLSLSLSLFFLPHDFLIFGWRSSDGQAGHKTRYPKPEPEKPEPVLPEPEKSEHYIG